MSVMRACDLHSACRTVWPYQSKTCCGIASLHVHAHSFELIGVDVAIYIYVPLGVLSCILNLIPKRHKRIRPTVNLRSSRVSRIGDSFQAYPGGPNAIIIMRSFLAFVRKF
eukprot:8398995-Pyramimonas_sp.AAC.1